MSCRDGWGRTAIILSIWFIVEVPGNRGLPVTKGRGGGGGGGGGGNKMSD